MVREDARLHLTMTLARFSNRAANQFVSCFNHQERVRSSNRVEMQEINEFWSKELQNTNPRASRKAMALPTDAGIDAWADAFERQVLPAVVGNWRQNGQA